MDPWTVALWFILLPPPPRWVEVPPTEADAINQAALQDVADLLDMLPRDHESWRPNSYGAELNWARNHWHELPFLPPLQDVELRLPSAAEARQRLAFIAEYLNWAETNKQCVPGGWDNPEYQLWNDLACETRSRERVWRLICQAHDSSRRKWQRQDSLRDLRNAVGDAAYYAGQWPPHVPIHRFRPDP